METNSDIFLDRTVEKFKNWTAYQAYLKDRRCETCRYWQPYRRSRRRFTWGYCALNKVLSFKWTHGEHCPGFEKNVTGFCLVHGGKSKRRMKDFRFWNV